MMFADTTICPNCGDENAYHNGLAYECPDCGYEWDSAVRAQSEDVVGDSCEHSYRQQDKARVGRKVDPGSIRRLFSPSYRFGKWHALYRETGLEEDYYNAIVDALLELGNYSAVRDLAPTGERAGQSEAEIFHRALRHYMESRDELPAFPKPEEWAAYIGAPLEVIQDACPAEGVDIQAFLPLQVESEDFTVLFYPRLLAIYEREISQSEEAREALSLRALENLFTELATGESNDPDDEVWFMRTKLSTQLSGELAAIQVYRDELSSGAIRTKISEVRALSLSTGEAVATIVGSHFEHLLDP